MARFSVTTCLYILEPDLDRTLAGDFGGPCCEQGMVYGLWIVKETWVRVQTGRCMLNRGFLGGRIPALINNTLPRRAYCTCRLSLHRRDKLDEGDAAVQEGICPPV